MNILLLSDANSSHTYKWAVALQEKGLHIALFSLTDSIKFSYESFGIQVFSGNIKVNNNGISLFKMHYLSTIKKLKKTIQLFNPDLVHAHYASSYGLLGALAGIHPLIISVWGSDVFDFPKISLLHRWIFKFNLSKANQILSTSHIMAEETQKYTSKKIIVTPFGVDMQLFTPSSPSLIEIDNIVDGDVVIGTIKLLEKKYGIDYLIDAFAWVVQKHPALSLKLLIVGGGSQLEFLKEKVAKHGLADKVIFTGMIPHQSIPFYHHRIDIFVALSIYDSESFGVAIVEAMASGTPVVVSNASGLAEVVENNVTGYVVEKKNSMAATKAIEKLLLDENLRIKMGNNGKTRVERFYQWKDNVNQMVKIYQENLHSCNANN